ncbi:hypothetical protein BESB_021540 [Besnoitia besnoiti]|uniref:SET domain-containing protein n=1 Tax=Besnoitia besnoiti TaxID=94643 RepID=A0A2A9M953_BESBE|nr:hypothetical protein BESB_021540 [Besnoitia besnoiti]PFH32213.1 hypothetical protein BESB_021540 [Besnoitia besnoiti]
MKSALAVELINTYSKDNHNGILRCDMHEYKGRVLYATKSASAGDTLLREPPLHAVRTDPNNPVFRELESLCKECNFHLEPIWYWCALNSIILEAQPPVPGLTSITHRQSELLRVLHVPAEITPCKEVMKLIQAFHLEDRTTPEDLELLLQVWIHNCFEQFEDPVGYVIYFMPSFSSHSCLPNVLWFTDEDHTFVLRARANIEEGDEVTLTYLSEEDLMRPTLHRRRVLSETKDFVCACERCSAPVDFSRGFRCPTCGVGCIYVEPDAELTGDEVDEVFAAAAAAGETVETFLPSSFTLQPSYRGVSPPPWASSSSGSSPPLCSFESRMASLPKDAIPLTVWLSLLAPSIGAARLSGVRRTLALLDSAPPAEKEASATEDARTKKSGGAEDLVSPAQGFAAVLERLHQALASVQEVTRLQGRAAPNVCLLCKRQWTLRERRRCLAIEALVDRFANPQDDADAEAAAAEAREEEEGPEEEESDVGGRRDPVSPRAGRPESESDDEGRGAASRRKQTKDRSLSRGGGGRREYVEGSCGGSDDGRKNATRGGAQHEEALGLKEKTQRKLKKKRDKESEEETGQSPSTNGCDGKEQTADWGRTARESCQSEPGDSPPQPASSETSTRRNNKKAAEAGESPEATEHVALWRRRHSLQQRASALRRLLKKKWKLLKEKQLECVEHVFFEVFHAHWHLACWLKTRAADATGPERVALHDKVVWQQRNLYPGLNAAVGWSLDEMAETVLLTYRDQPNTSPALSAESVKTLLRNRDILAAYEEAASILGTLFETDHQFVMDVTKKLGTIAGWIRNYGLEAEPSAAAWLTAGQRRFETSYAGHCSPVLLCENGGGSSWSVAERGLQSL